MPVVETLAVVAVVFLAGLVGGISGFGFALVVVPILSVVIGPTEAVLLVNAISPVHSLAMFMLLRRNVQWRTASRLLVAGAFGMPLGAYGLVVMSPDALRIAIGITVLLGTVVLWRGFEIHRGGAVAEALTGFISGVLKTSTGINGPPLVLYLQGTGIEALPFRATTSAVFVVSGVMGAAVLAVGHQLTTGTLAQSAVSVPFIFAGLLTGNRLFPRIAPARFRQLVLGLLLVSSTVIITTTVLR